MGGWRGCDVDEFEVPNQTNVSEGPTMGRNDSARVAESLLVHMPVVLGISLGLEAVIKFISVLEPCTNSFQN